MGLWYIYITYNSTSLSLVYWGFIVSTFSKSSLFHLAKITRNFSRIPRSGGTGRRHIGSCRRVTRDRSTNQRWAAHGSSNNNRNIWKNALIAKVKNNPLAQCQLHSGGGRWLRKVPQKVRFKHNSTHFLSTVLMWIYSINIFNIEIRLFDENHAWISPEMSLFLIVASPIIAIILIV